jgi:hypothetical protein
MALASTQPLTEMNTRYISWGKGGRCVRLTTLPPSCAVVMKSGNLNFLEPSGPLQVCNGAVFFIVKGVVDVQSGGGRSAPNTSTPTMYSDTQMCPLSQPCLPACTHVSNREPLNKFSRNFISVNIDKITFHLSEFCGTCIDGCVLTLCGRKPYFRHLERMYYLHLPGRNTKSRPHIFIFTEIS